MENVNSAAKIIGSRRFKMDANKFMTEYRRMCTSYARCADCPLYADKPCSDMPSRYTKEFATKLINTIKEWSTSHPVTTRADLLKKIYPNAPTAPSGALLVCPTDLDVNFKCEEQSSCIDCRKKYWLKVVKE